jgi:hypothetical protein
MTADLLAIIVVGITILCFLVGAHNDYRNGKREQGHVQLAMAANCMFWLGMALWF